MGVGVGCIQVFMALKIHVFDFNVLQEVFVAFKKKKKKPDIVISG